MNISQLLENLKVNIDSMSITEILLGGIATAVLSMIVVFVILIIIAGMIKLINKTPNKKFKEEAKAQDNIEVIEEVVESLEENLQLVAVVTASIIAATSNKNIVVRRITRSNNVQTNWEKMSKSEI